MASVYKTQASKGPPQNVHTKGGSHVIESAATIQCNLFPLEALIPGPGAVKLNAIISLAQARVVYTTSPCLRDSAEPKILDLLLPLTSRGHVENEVD